MIHKNKINWKTHFIELFIVIIGISIAFALNNLAESNRDQKQKNVYLNHILDDLSKDSLLLKQNIRINERKLQKLTIALQRIAEKAPLDSVMPYVLEIGNYDFFSPDNFTLTSMLQSGDFKLIDSEEMKRELLRLQKTYDGIDVLQQNFLDALDQNYFPMLIGKVDMMDMEAKDPAFFYSLEVKNYCAYTAAETQQHIGLYKFALNQVGELTEMIRKEIN